MLDYRTRVTQAGVLCVVLAAPSAWAGDKKADDKKDDDNVVFDNTKPKQQNAIEADDSGVVFDNREPPKEEPKELDNATTFATTDPDAPDERRRRFRSGFSAGFRLGWSLPGGEIEKGSKLSAGVTGALGAGAQLGYRFTPNLIVALDMGGGYVFPDNCGGGANCSGWQLRGGLMGIWRILPFEYTSPWVGLGPGYEYLVQSVSVGGSEVSRAVHGLQYFEFSAGVDFRTSRTYAGPYLSFAMGRFGSYSTSGSTPNGEIDDSGSIDDPATHNWITFGLHALLD
ncbi:MAG: hypothetical protein R3B13_15900 [Polyangiaceae bacterium]